MTEFIILHLKMSFLFLFPAVFLLRMIRLKSSTKLIILYGLLLKSFIPSGLFRLPFSVFSVNPAGGGFSYEENSLKTGMGTNFRSLPMSGEQTAVILILLLIIMLIIYALLAARSVSRNIDRSPGKTSAKTEKIFNSLKARFALSGRFRLHFSKHFQMPFIWFSRGWMIVLPEKISRMNEQEIESILSHELSHIKRHDFLKFSLLHAVKIMFFFSPFIHYVVREILTFEEIETDRTAVMFSGISAQTFGKTVLKMSLLQHKNFLYTPAFTKSGNKRRLKMRLENLSPRKYFSGKVQVISTAAVVISVVLLSSISPLSSAARIGMKKEMHTPVEYSRITMRFGNNINPVSRKSYNHRGIDLASVSGTPVLAAYDGKIVKTGYDNGYGNYIIIEHSGGIETLYAHLRSIHPVSGTDVSRGTEIGTVGSSGMSTGPHLHFEIHENGIPVNPEDYVSF